MLETDAISFWEKAFPRFFVANAVVKYMQVSGIADVRFIHDGLFYEVFDPYFNQYDYALRFDNKAYYPLIFHDVRQPRVIAMRLNGFWVDHTYQILDFEKVMRLCKQETDIVLKYAKGTCGGNGVFFYKSSDYSQLEKNLKGSKLDVVLQTVQTQRSELSMIHPSSLNTIRIMTLLLQTGAVVLSSVLRMGINGSKVDNASAGGIVCGIDSNGNTKNIAFDKYGNCYINHPSGTCFSNIHITNYSKCAESSVALQERLPYCRMISWDWVIDEAGSPVLIEANMSNGELDFHQFCNGPIFSDFTEQVISEIIQNESELLS